MNQKVKNSLIRIYQAKIDYHNAMLAAYQEKLDQLKKEGDDDSQSTSAVQTRSRRRSQTLEREHQDYANRALRER
jgi:hypothetical protein